jgi:predicted kinase
MWTSQMLFDQAEREMENGRSVILDATFSRADQRAAFIRRFGELGLRYCFIEFRADDDLIKARLKARDAKLDEVSDARLEDFEALNGVYERPSELAAKEAVVVDASGAPETLVAAALRELAVRNLKAPESCC